MSEVILPVEYKVLVEPIEVGEKTNGGLFLPDNVREKEQVAQVKGIVIAVGGNAFDEWKEPIPKVGDKVFLAKYAGMRIEDDSGKVYQLINDKEIAGILRDE